MYKVDLNCSRRKGQRHEGVAGSEAPLPRLPSISLGIVGQHTLYVARGREENKKTDGLDFPVDRGGGRPS